MSMMNGGSAAGSVAGAGSLVGDLASVVPAYIQPIDPPTLPTINFQFNPQKIDLKFDGEWGFWKQTSTNGPPMQWKGAKTQDVKVPIILDAFALPKPAMLIQATIDTLVSFTLPTPESLLDMAPKAPIVCFGWGTNVVLPKAIVSSVSITYKRFLAGLPIRADLEVWLKAIPLPSPFGPTNPSSGGLAPRRTHTVMAGDTLASISTAAYGNPNRWRALAEVNGIDDPLRLRIGQVLDVPDKNTAHALS